LKGKFLAAFIFVGYLLQSCLQISHFFRFLEKRKKEKRKKKGPYIFEIIVPKIIDKICNKIFSTERNLFAPKFIYLKKKKSLIRIQDGWPCHDTYIIPSSEQSNLNTDADHLEPATDLITCSRSSVVNLTLTKQCQ
jgi:hypothetical protein